jgi:hypothetical protein
MAVLRAQPGLAIFASLLWLLGVLMFLTQLLRLTSSRAEARSMAPGE